MDPNKIISMITTEQPIEHPETTAMTDRKMDSPTLTVGGSTLRRWVRRTWAPGELRRDVRLWAIWSGIGSAVIVGAMTLVLIAWPGPTNPGTPFEPTGPTAAGGAALIPTTPDVEQLTATTARTAAPRSQPSAPRVVLRGPLTTPQPSVRGPETPTAPSSTQAVSAPPTATGSPTPPPTSPPAATSRPTVAPTTRP